MKISEVSNSSVSRTSAPHQKVSTAGKLQKSKPLVLILGADADARLLYKSFLKIWDFHAAEAVGIEELLAITEYFQPELILLDCVLGFESNLETIQKIRGNIFLRNIPLVLVSGHSQAKIQTLALKTGADEFLVKPLIFNNLRIILQRYIDVPAQSDHHGELL